MSYGQQFGRNQPQPVERQQVMRHVVLHTEALIAVQDIRSYMQQLDARDTTLDDKLALYDLLMTSIDKLQMYDRDHTTLEDAIRFLSKKLESIEPAFVESDERHLLRVKILCCLGIFHAIPRNMTSHQLSEGVLLFAVQQDNEYNAIKALENYQIFFNFQKFCVSSELSTFVEDSIKMYANITTKIREGGVFTEIAQLELDLRKIRLTTIDKETLKKLMDKYSRETELCIYEAATSRVGDRVKFYPKAKQSFKVLAHLPTLYTNLFNYTEKNRERFNCCLELCLTLLDFTRCSIDDDKRKAGDKNTLSLIYIAQIKTLEFLAKVVKVFSTSHNKQEIGMKFADSYLNIFSCTKFEPLPERKEFLNSLKQMFDSEFGVHMIKLIPELCFEANILGMRISEQESLRVCGSEMVCDMFSKTIRYLSYELLAMVLNHCQIEIIDTKNGVATNVKYLNLVIELVQHAMTIENDQKKPVRRLIFHVLECLVHKLGLLADYYVPFFKSNEYMSLTSKHMDIANKLPPQSPANTFLKINMNALVPTRPEEEHVPLSKMYRDCRHSKLNSQMSPSEVRMLWIKIFETAKHLLSSMKQTNPINGGDIIGNELEILEELLIRGYKSVEILKLHKIYQQVVRKIPENPNSMADDKKIIELYCTTFYQNLDSSTWIYLLKRNFSRMTGNVMICSEQFTIVMKLLEYPLFFEEYCNWFFMYIRETIKKFRDSSYEKNNYDRKIFQKIFSPNPAKNTDKTYDLLSKVYRPHVVPIVKALFENIFKTPDCSFYLHLIRSMHKSSNELVQKVLREELKPLFSSIYLCMLRLMSWERKSHREVISDTTMSFAPTFIGDARFIPLWMIAVKLCLKPINTISCLNQCYSSIDEITTNVNCSSLFDLGCQDVGSINETLHDWLVQIAGSPSETTKYRLENNKRIGRFGFSINNRYFDNYPLVSQINTSFNEPLLHLYFTRNMPNFKDAVQHAEKCNLLNNAEKLIDDLTSTETIVGTMPLGDALNVAMKVISSWMNYKEEMLTQKQKESYYTKTLMYIEDAFALCRKVILTALRPHDIKIPREEAFQNTIKQSLQAVRARMDRNDIRQIVKKNDLKLRIAMKSALFVVFASAFDKVGRPEDYKLMHVVFQNQVLMAVLEQLDEQFSDGFYMDSSMLAETIANFVWDNGSYLGFAFFKRAVMLVESFLGAPAGYGYKLPLFSYTLKYIQENALDIKIFSRRGSLNFFFNVLKEAPYYFVHENFTIFFNFFTYMIRNDLYENYTQNCELAREAMVELFKKFGKRNNDSDGCVVRSPESLTQLIEHIFSENQELSKCGISVISEIFSTFTDQPMQLVAEQLYQCMKAKIKFLTNHANTCTIDTYIGTLYGITEAMKMDEVKYFIASSNDDDFGPLIELAKQSISRTESQIQEVWKSRTAASAFADVINEEFNYYPAVRLAETKFLIAAYEYLVKMHQPGQLQIDNPVCIYIKEVTSAFLKLITNCSGNLRETLAQELLKAKTAFLGLGYDVSFFINVTEFRAACRELFSGLQKFNLEALSAFVCITSIVNSETLISDIRSVFNKTIKVYLENFNNMFTDQFRSIKKVIRIICDRQMKDVEYLEPLLILIGRLSTTYFIDEEFQFEKDIIPLINAYPEQVINFFCVSEKIYDRYFYQLFKKLLCFNETTALKQYLKDNPIVFTQLLSKKAKSPDGKSWLDVKFNEYHSREYWDLFVYGIILHTIVKEREWWGKQKEICDLIKVYFDSDEFTSTYCITLHINTTGSTTKIKKLDLPMYRVPEYMVKILLLYFIENLDDFDLLLTINRVNDNQYFTDFTFYHVFLAEEIYPKVEPIWRKKMIFHFFNELMSFQHSNIKWNSKMSCFLHYIINPCFEWYLSRFDGYDFVNQPLSETENINILIWIVNQISKFDNQKTVSPFFDNLLTGILQFLKIAARLHCASFKPPGALKNSEELKVAIRPVISLCFKLVRNKSTSVMKFDPIVRLYACHTIGYFAAEFGFAAGPAVQSFESLLELTYDEANDTDEKSIRGMLGAISSIRAIDSNILSVAQKIKNTIIADKNNLKPLIWMMRIVKINVDYFYVIRNQIFNHIISSLIKIPNVFASSIPLQKEYLEFIEIIGRWDDIRKIRQNASDTRVEIQPELDFNFTFDFEERLEDPMENVYVNYGINYLLRINALVIVNKSRNESARNHYINECIYKKSALLISNLLTQKYYGDIFALTTENISIMCSLHKQCVEDSSKNIKPDVSLLCSYFQVLSEAIKVLPRQKVIDTVKTLQKLFTVICENYQNVPINTALTFFQTVLNVLKISKDGCIEVPELNKYLIEEFNTMGQSSSKNNKVPIKLGISLLRLYCQANGDFLENRCLNNVIVLIKYYTKHVITHYSAVERSNPQLEKDGSDFVEVLMEALSARLVYYSPEKRDKVIKEILPLYAEHFPGLKILAFLLTICLNLLKINAACQFIIAQLAAIAKTHELRIISSVEHLKTLIECIVLIQENPDFTRFEDAKALYHFYTYNSFLFGKNTNWKLIALQDRDIQPDIVSRLVHLFGHQTFESARNLIPVMGVIWKLILYQGNTNVEDARNNKLAASENGTPQQERCASSTGTFVNVPSFFNLLNKVCHFDSLSEGHLYNLPLNGGESANTEEEPMQVDTNNEEPMRVDNPEDVSMETNEINHDSVTTEALTRIYNLYAMVTGTDIQVELCALFHLLHCSIDMFSNCLYKLIGTIWKCLHPSERTLVEAYMPRLFYSTLIPHLNHINPDAQVKFLSQQRINADVYFATVIGSFLNRFLFPLVCDLDPIPYLPSDLVRFLSKEFGDQFSGLLMLEKHLDNLSDPLTPNFIKNPALLQLEGPHMKQLELMDHMSEIYTSMQEKDQVYSIWSHRGYHPETAKAVLNFNHNEFANCIANCEKVLESYSHGKNSPYVTHLTVELKVEVNEHRDMWLRGLKEMGQWERIRDYANHESIQDPCLLVEASYYLQNWGVIKDLRKQIAVSITPDNNHEMNIFEGIMLLMMCDTKSDKIISLKQDLKKKMDENRRATASIYKKYPKLFTDAHIINLQYAPILVEMAEALEWSVMDNMPQTNEELDSEICRKFRSLMNVWASRFQIPALLYNTSSVQMYFNWRKSILSHVVNSLQKNSRAPSEQNQKIYANISPLIKTTITTLTSNFVKFITKNRQYDRALEEIEKLKCYPLCDLSGGINANLLLLKTFNKKAKFWKTSQEDKEKCLNTVLTITNNLDYDMVKTIKPEYTGLFFQERAIALGRSGHFVESENLFCQAVTAVGTVYPLGKDIWRKFANMFEEQMNQGIPLTTKLFRSGLLATLESLRYADLWRNKKNIANLIFYLKKATILGGEYQRLADAILIKKGADIPLLTWTHYLNDLVLELSQRPNEGIKLILLNFARQFPQRIFYALRTYLTNGMIEELIYANEVENAGNLFQPVPYNGLELIQQTGQNRGILDLKDVLAAAIKVKAATISRLYKICKDIDNHLDSKLDSVVSEGNEIIECMFRSAESGLKQNSRDAWIPVTINNLKKWKSNVRNVLNTETSLSRKISDLMKEKVTNLFSNLNQSNANMRDIGDQLVEFINALTIAMFNGSKAGFGNFDPSKSVARYTPRQCSLDVFTYGMYGIHQSADKQVQEYYCYTIAHIVPCFKYTYRNGVIIKEILVRGNNGKHYAYMYEKHKDVPMRNRINIFYKFLNNMMTKESGSRARHLQFAECRYIPVSENGCLFDYSLLGDIGTEFMAFRLFTLYDTMEQSYENKRNCHQTAAIFIDRAKARAPLTTEKSAKILEEMVYGSNNRQSVVNTNMLTKWMQQKYTESNVYYVARKRFSRKLAMIGMSGHILHMKPSTLKNSSFDALNMNLFTTNYDIEYHSKCLKYENTLYNHIRLTPNIETYIHHTVEGHYLNAVIAFIRCFANRSMKSHIRLILLDQLLLQHGREDQTTLDSLEATLTNLDTYFKTFSNLDGDKCLPWDVIKSASVYTRHAQISITDFPWF